MNQPVPQNPTKNHTDTIATAAATAASMRFKRWTEEALELSDHPDLPDDERLLCRLMVLSMGLKRPLLRAKPPRRAAP